MTGNLKYWLNGKPVLPDSGLDGFKYWFNGEVYCVYEPAAAGPTNLKTINAVAKASIKTVNGVALGSIKSVNGIT